MNKHAAENICDLQRFAGIYFNDALALRRIAITLHRWFEKQCGDSDQFASWAIVRDDETDRPYLEVHPHHAKSYRVPIYDAEKGARKRLAKIMTRYPHLGVYVQTDPRGAPLRILRPGDIPEGKDVACYYDRGFPISAC